MIILYDHVHPVGAFAKNAAIDVSSLHFVSFLFPFLPSFISCVSFFMIYSACSKSGTNILISGTKKFLKSFL